jgi:hypothetical protein
MRRMIEAMLIAAIAIDITYWTIWFTQRDWLASEHTQAYYDFENAFPLADCWLGLACVLALVALRRRRPIAFLWLVSAGAAGLYLGCMDLLYDLEHGIFTKGAGGTVEGLIVALTWAFSIVILWWTWQNRADLLGLDSP